jgi:hypothetical protein
VEISNIRVIRGHIAECVGLSALCIESLKPKSLNQEPNFELRTLNFEHSERLKRRILRTENCEP